MVEKNCSIKIDTGTGENERVVLIPTLELRSPGKGVLTGSQF
jgi:hypothetical protein